MKTLVIILLVCLGLFSCKKEQPDMSVLNQGCDCAKEVSADFYMEEMTIGSNEPLSKFTDTDSIFAGSTVRFRAKNESTEYKWYVGAEIVEDVNKVIRQFPVSFLGQSLPITLVVKKKPNKICFPNDDGYDSITKYINVAILGSDYFNNTNVPIAGNFRVKSATMLDSVDISSILYKSPSGATERFVIYDIPNYNNDDSLYTYTTVYTYRQFWGHLSQYLVDFHHRMDGKVTINMENLNPGQPDQYFEGRKL